MYYTLVNVVNFVNYAHLDFLALVALALDRRLEQQIPRPVQAVRNGLNILRHQHVTTLAHRCDRLLLLLLLLRMRQQVQQLHDVRVEGTAAADDAAVVGEAMRCGHRKRTALAATGVGGDLQLDTVGNADQPREAFSVAAQRVRGLNRMYRI